MRKFHPYLWNKQSITWPLWDPYEFILLEDKIHSLAQPCNVLYFLCILCKVLVSETVNFGNFDIVIAFVWLLLYFDPVNGTPRCSFRAKPSPQPQERNYGWKRRESAQQSRKFSRFYLHNYVPWSGARNGATSKFHPWYRLRETGVATWHRITYLVWWCSKGRDMQ